MAKAVVVFILMTFMLSSCKTQQIKSDVSYIRDSVVVRVVEKEVLIPKQVLSSASINVDSLMRLLQAGVSPKIIERTLVQYDEETGLRASLLIDALGNITAVCEQQEQYIKFLLEQVDHYRTEKQTTVIVEKPTFLSRMLAALKLSGIWILIAIVFVIAYLLYKK
jgi:hypothetical protein